MNRQVRQERQGGQGLGASHSDAATEKTRHAMTRLQGGTGLASRGGAWHRRTLPAKRIISLTPL